jgi:Ca2+-transporting ATPase
MKNIGLTSEEAAKLLEKHGRNEIVSGKKIRPLEIFISQFKSFLILILFIAAGLAALAGERLDTIFILIIIVLNAIFGFIQEFKAEKAIAALKTLVVARVRVVRDGKEVEINATELVPGDVFIISEGQKIPADAKLLDSVNLEVNEASLTGESIPVAKEVNEAVEDDKFSVFMGTVAERGKGKALVSTTGMNTKFGKIASLLKEIEEEPTPLQKHLDTLGKQLGVISIFGAILVFGLGFLHGGELFETLLTGASLAVAVVPEGLPAIVTITLAIGVQRMARRQSIIRKLSSIEAIGSVDVICSDKTGTLTKNEMVVRKVWVDNKVSDVEDQSISKDTEGFAKLLRIGILCNDSTISEDNGKVDILGDRTEGSLLVLAKEKGIDIEKYKENGNPQNEFPFDSKLKRMAVVWGDKSNSEVLAKGAPETILERSIKILTSGKTTELSESDRKNVSKVIEDLASQGFRLLQVKLNVMMPKKI